MLGQTGQEPAQDMRCHHQTGCEHESIFQPRRTPALFVLFLGLPFQACHHFLLSPGHTTYKIMTATAAQTHQGVLIPATWPAWRPS